MLSKYEKAFSLIRIELSKALSKHENYRNLDSYIKGKVRISPYINKCQ